MNLIRKLGSYLTLLKRIEPLYDQIKNDYKNPKMLLGKQLIKLNSQISSPKNLFDVEFQVFSQWGDDGIIQYLINRIDFPEKTFVEFGVEDYKESNTRFLMLNNNWSGLVLDGDEENIRKIRSDPSYWTHELFAQQLFVTKENINEAINSGLIKKGFGKELGILSIDIDGNDYWVWNEINIVNPVLVVAEFNSAFGPNRAVTVPYKPDFVMNRIANPFYWGASLRALYNLANEKGYTFIGCNSNGNNAYFVRNDKLSGLTPVSCEQGYVRGKYRLRFFDNGEPMDWVTVQDSLKGLTVYNIETKQLEVFS